MAVKNKQAARALQLKAEIASSLTEKLTRRKGNPENVARLYYGDNLDILRRKLKSDSVDLCYIDPPFNSKIQSETTTKSITTSGAKTERRPRLLPTHGLGIVPQLPDIKIF